MAAAFSWSRLWGGIDSRLDRIAIGVSGLCLAHCLASSVLLVVLSSAGALLDPAIHEVGLTMAIGFAIVALGRGYLAHGYVTPVLVGSFGIGMMAGALTLDHGSLETFFTLIGVLVVALGHDLNHRAAR